MVLDSRKNRSYKLNISETEERDTARETRHKEDLPKENRETKNDTNNNDTDNNGVIDKQAEELTEDDKELERSFQIQTEAMDHCSLLQLELREKLPKVKLTKEIKSSVNRIFGRYLIGVTTIPETTYKAYVIGKAIAFKLEMKLPERKGTAKRC